MDKEEEGKGSGGKNGRTDEERMMVMRVVGERQAAKGRSNCR